MGNAPKQRGLVRQRNGRDLTPPNTFGKVTIFGVAFFVNKRHF